MARIGWLVLMVWLAAPAWAGKPFVGADVDWLALLNESQQLVSQKFYPQAEQKGREALALAERSFGPDDPRVAKTLVRLANVHHWQKRYEAAVPLLERAIEILERHPEGDGPHAELPAALSAYGAHLSALQRGPEAERAWRRALAERERLKGPDHPMQVWDLNALGQSAQGRGEYREAEQHLRRALEIRQASLPAGSGHIAESWQLLVRLYEKQQRWDEAMGALEEAIKTAEQGVEARIAYSEQKLASYKKHLATLQQHQAASRAKAPQTPLVAVPPKRDQPRAVTPAPEPEGFDLRALLPAELPELPELPGVVLPELDGVVRGVVRLATGLAVLVLLLMLAWRLSPQRTEPDMPLLRDLNLSRRRQEKYVPMPKRRSTAVVLNGGPQASSTLVQRVAGGGLGDPMDLVRDKLTSGVERVLKEAAQKQLLAKLQEVQAMAAPPMPWGQPTPKAVVLKKRQRNS